MRDLGRVTSEQPDARRHVCEVARRLLGADADVLFVPVDAELVSDTVSGEPLPEMRMHAEDPRSAVARAFSKQESVLTHRDVVELDLLRAYDARTVLAVPVTRVGVRIGVCLWVWRSARRRLSARERRLAEILANEKGMAIQRAQLVVQAVELMRAQVRTRLARDLHDSIAQELAVLRIYAETVAEAFRERPDMLADAVPRLETHAAKAQAEMRELLDALRVGRPLVDASIPDVVDALVADFRARCRDVDVSVEIPADGLDVRASVRETIYFVLREALHNAEMHSRASHVRVHARTLPDFVTLVVEDDGLGFDPGAEHAGRLGLVGMRERAELAGGELDVRSEPGLGTTVSLVIRSPQPARAY